MIQGATEFNNRAQMVSNVGLGLSGNAGFGYQGYWSNIKALSKSLI